MANNLVPYGGRTTLSLDVVPETGAPDSLLAADRFGFDSAAIVDSVGMWRIWKLRLTATSRSVFETWITPLLLSARRRVRVRLGVDTGTDVVWAVPEFCRVLTVDGSAHNNASSQSGYPFEMTLVGQLYELALKQSVVARNGSISEIVASIATAHNLDHVVEPTSNPPVALVQAYESDLRFIERRLLPSAVNSSGMAGYYLYADEGVLHFHTRGYKQEPWSLPYNPVASNLICSDDAQENARSGGTATEIVSYDPLSARTLVSDAIPANYTRLGRRLAQAEGGVLTAAHAGPNQAVFEINRIQNNYALHRDKFERISFSLANALDLKAGRIVKVQLTDLTDPFIGYYHIERVETTIAGGTAISAATAARGELNGGRKSEGGIQSAEGAPVVIAVPFEAPGKDPNFSDASSPVLGLGAVVTVRSSGS